MPKKKKRFFFVCAGRQHNHNRSTNYKYIDDDDGDDGDDGDAHDAHDFECECSTNDDAAHHNQQRKFNNSDVACNNK